MKVPSGKGSPGTGTRVVAPLASVDTSMSDRQGRGLPGLGGCKADELERRRRR